MAKKKVKSNHPVFGELSDTECEDCGDLIPLKRLKLVAVAVCVGCMEEREAKGVGTPRHRMNYHVTSKGDEVESIETTIVRKDR